MTQEAPPVIAPPKRQRSNVIAFIVIAVLILVATLMGYLARFLPRESPSPRMAVSDTVDPVISRCTELAAAGYASCVTDQLGKGVPQEQVDTVCSAIARAFREQCIKSGGI
jgi:Na+-transporting methylmalonyl-CoA/oxaloacetate decarboxylase gamma subunit